MSNYEHIKPYQWQKGKSGNPNGRPRKVENAIKEYFFDEHNIRLTRAETQEIIKGILGKTTHELFEMAKDDRLPFWVSMIARKAHKDFKNGNVELLSLLFDRVYGRPTQGHELSGNDGENLSFTVKVIDGAND